MKLNDLLREVAWSGFTAIINMDFMNGVAELLWADEPDSPVLVSKLRKLGLIEDPVLTPADLQAWSYVRVNEFFETKKSAKQKLMRLWARVPKSSRSFRHCNLLPTRHPRRDWPNGRI